MRIKNFGPTAALIIVALSIIFSAIYDLEQILDYPQHLFIFQDYPAWLIQLRWYFSFGLRVFLIIAALGLILKLTWAKRSIVAIAWFTIITLIFKHPFQAIYYANIYFGMNENLVVKPVPWDNNLVYYPELMIILLNLYLSDLLLNGFYLFVLSRPNIKKAFYESK